MRSKIVGGRWTAVPNAIINSGLSPHAITLLIYRLSKPDDWSDSNKDFKRVLHCGDNKLKKVIAELREAGYVENQVLPQNKDGTFSGKIRVWYREPNVRQTERSKTERSVSVPSYTNTDPTNTDDTNTEVSSSSLRSEEDQQAGRAKKKEKKKRKTKERLLKKNSSVNSPSSARPKKKVAPKKKSEDQPNLTYRLWEVWRDRTAEHFHMPPAPRPEPKHMHHLKHLGKKLAERISIRNGEAAHDDDVVDGFRIFCQGALQAADDWQERNFTPDILHSQLDRLILAIRQKQMGSKKQRAKNAKWEELEAKWREQDRLEQQQQQLEP